MIELPLIKAYVLGLATAFVVQRLAELIAKCYKSDEEP